MPSVCEVWSDHDWQRGALLENGRHPVMGAFLRYRVCCTRCARETMETQWLSLPIRRPVTNNEEE